MDNYFELYQLPVSFFPDPAAVKAKYYEYSRTYHPDRFAQADKSKQLEALTIAAQNNKAWKTLSNPDATIAYVLELNGVLQHDEKYALPSTFLMEMMDFNEEISEYEMGGDTEMRTRLEQTLANLLTDWNTEAEPLMRSFDPTTPEQPTLLKIKDMYFRKKYLLRIKERIDKFAAR